MTAAHIIIDKGYLRTEQTEVSILIVQDLKLLLD